MKAMDHPVIAAAVLLLFFGAGCWFLGGAFRDVSFKNGVFRPHTRALYLRGFIAIREAKLFFLSYFSGLIWICFFLCAFVALSFTYVYSGLVPARPVLTQILLKGIAAGIFWGIGTQGALLIQTWSAGLDFKRLSYLPYGSKKKKKCKSRAAFFLHALLPMIFMTLLALAAAVVLIAFAVSL